MSTVVCVTVDAFEVQRLVDGRRVRLHPACLQRMEDDDMAHFEERSDLRSHHPILWAAQALQPHPPCAWCRRATAVARDYCGCKDTDPADLPPEMIRCLRGQRGEGGEGGEALEESAKNTSAAGALAPPVEAPVKTSGEEGEALEESAKNTSAAGAAAAPPAEAPVRTRGEEGEALALEESAKNTTAAGAASAAPPAEAPLTRTGALAGAPTGGPAEASTVGSTGTAAAAVRSVARRAPRGAARVAARRSGRRTRWGSEIDARDLQRASHPPQWPSVLPTTPPQSLTTPHSSQSEQSSSCSAQPPSKILLLEERAQPLPRCSGRLESLGRSDSCDGGEQHRSQTQDIETIMKLPDDRIIISYNSFTIKVAEIKRLRLNMFLNDEILNFYLQLVCECNKFTYAYLTQFYPKLATCGYNSVSTWNKNVDIFAMRYILIPIHTTGHWSLCAVDNEAMTIKIYDSMCRNHENALEVIKNYLQLKAIDLGSDLNVSHYTTSHAEGIAQQRNGYDCGVYVCFYGRRISQGKLCSGNHAYVCKLRELIMQEILSCKLLPEELMEDAYTLEGILNPKDIREDSAPEVAGGATGGAVGGAAGDAAPEETEADEGNSTESLHEGHLEPQVEEQVEARQEMHQADGSDSTEHSIEESAGAAARIYAAQQAEYKKQRYLHKLRISLWLRRPEPDSPAEPDEC